MSAPSRTTRTSDVDDGPPQPATRPDSPNTASKPSSSTAVPPRSHPSIPFATSNAAASTSTPSPTSNVGAGPSSQAHPLLAPMPTSTTLASELDPFAYDIVAEQNRLEAEARRASDMPEKCLTFCSQRQDASPMCKMFCLRKRKVVGDRAEQLARLRPPPRRVNVLPVQTAASASSSDISDSISTASSSSASTSSSSSPFFNSTASSILYRHLNPVGASSAVSSSSNGSSNTGDRSDRSPSSPPFSFSSLWSWSPFEALRRRVEPYSFIYVRGSPEGPVGRYMEELEYDDGHNDFGLASRGADGALRRKRLEPKMESIDWGEEGYILHLPFLSLFHPIIAIPSTINKILSPSISLLTRYRDSFYDGSQTRSLKKIQQEIQDGSALKMLDKFQAYWAKRVKEKEEEIERERTQRVGKEE